FTRFNLDFMTRTKTHLQLPVEARKTVVTLLMILSVCSARAARFGRRLIYLTARPGVVDRDRLKWRVPEELLRANDIREWHEVDPSNLLGTFVIADLDWNENAEGGPYPTMWKARMMAALKTLLDSPTTQAVFIHQEGNHA